MENKTKRILKCLISLILIILVSSGIILGTNLLYKINHKTEDEIIAEKNQVKLGEESVLYVDLTKRPDDYEKISKTEENNQITSKTEENNSTQDIINKINQDNYETEIDLNSGKLVSNGEEKDINELIKTAEGKEKVYNYLKENVIGDIKEEDGKIKIENPYSTKTLIMQTDNLTELQNCGNVESIVKVSDDIYCVHYNDAKDTKEGYNILKNTDIVDNVSTDIQVSVQDDENTVSSLEVTGNNYAWGVQRTGLSQYKNKLNYGENNTEVKVAVLDTGIRKTHEVFKNQETADRLDMTYAYNYVGNNTDVTDDKGHGTMVAGIIAESTSNNVKIVPVKVLGSNGKGSFSTVLQAISAIEDKVDIINLSLGESESKFPSETKAIIEQSLKSVYDSGTVIVCAAGNSGEEDVYYPASSNYTIAVSAITSEKNIASFSNYGSTIDFSAPGQGLILPYYTGDNLYNSSFDPTSEAYSQNSGTSFAAPFVTSAFAMVLSENKNYTIDQMKNILKQNCEDLGETGKDKYYGYGSINFDLNMFKTPVIANVKVTDTWAKENSIELYAVSGTLISKWGYTYEDVEPEDDSWRSFSQSSKLVKITLKVSENKKIYMWLKDEDGNIVKQEVTVQKVDNLAPTITGKLAVKSKNGTSITCNLASRDQESGISKIEWYYKKSTEDSYKMVSNQENNVTENIERSYTFNGLEKNTKYSIYAKIYDQIGNSVSTEKIEVTTDSSEKENNTTTNNTTENGNETNNTITNNTTTNNTTGNTTNNTITNTVNNTVTNNTTTNTVNNVTENTNITDNTTNITNESTGNTNTSNTENNSNTNTSNENTKSNTVMPVTNTNGNNNTNTVTIKANKDNTMASKILPKTGTKRVIILTVIIISISGIFTLVKYNKMKDVK